MSRKRDTNSAIGNALRGSTRDRFVELLDCFLEVALPTIHVGLEHDRLGIVWQAAPGDRQLYPRSVVVPINTSIGGGRRPGEPPEDLVVSATHCLLPHLPRRVALGRIELVIKNVVRFRRRTIGERELWIESDGLLQKTDRVTQRLRDGSDDR